MDSNLKSKIGYGLLTVFTVITLVGCENLVSRNDLREADQRKQVQDLQRSSADVNSRFSEIEQDLRSMNGRVEVVESKLGQHNQETQRVKAIAEQSGQDANNKVKILQDEVAKLHEEVAGLTAQLNSIKSAPPAEAAAEKPVKNGFDAAEELFEKKEWRKAIVAYQKFRDANPKSKKFPEATYKTGVCFQELSMKDEAKTFFDELIAKYPNSAEAKKAKARLKSLKK